MLKKKILAGINLFSKTYINIGYPLLPLTKKLRGIIRFFYHRTPVLRHDSKLYLRSCFLHYMHTLLIVEHPSTFKIYKDRIVFNSSNSAISIHGYYVGEIEYHLIQFMVKQIGPGFQMIDVGAHHGTYSLVAGYELKSNLWDGQIYSFEPDPINFDFLSGNINSNNLNEYITPYMKAVYSEDGENEFATNKTDNSGHVLVEKNELENYSSNDLKNNKKVEKNKVKTTKLDSFKNIISHVDLIKIDIQGFEAEALEGAKDIISRDRPILIVEAVKEWESSNRSKKFMLNNDYCIYGVNSRGELCELNSKKVFVSWDCVAIPKERLNDFLN